MERVRGDVKLLGNGTARNKTRGPWALTFCLRTNLAICQSSRSCTFIPPFFLRDQNWAYVHSMSSGSWDMGRFPKLSYLGMELGKWPKCHRLHIYTLSIPGGRNSAYFRSTGSGFRDTGPFSKLPYLGVKFGHWPKFQKLHIYSLSTSGYRNWPLFLLYGQQFSRYGPIFKIAIFGHGTWQVSKVPEVAHILSFYPQ